jgi:predicted nucleic acid-binding protein
MPVTVVFDTNILFSAAGWRGRPYQCVALARAGKIQAVSCAHLMD